MSKQSKESRPRRRSEHPASYEPPRIEYLGNLSDLTEGMGGSRPDLGQGGPSKLGNG